MKQRKSLVHFNHTSRGAEGFTLVELRRDSLWSNCW